MHHGINQPCHIYVITAIYDIYDIRPSLIRAKLEFLSWTEKLETMLPYTQNKHIWTTVSTQQSKIRSEFIELNNYQKTAVIWLFP